MLFHRFLRVHFGDPVVLRFEAALQEEVGETFDELLEVYAATRLAVIFCIADVFHVFT